MLNVTQTVFNEIAKKYPLQSAAIQKLFSADAKENERLFNSYLKQVQKQMPENLTSYAGVVLDALILTVAHKEIRSYINENPTYLGILPITETMEGAIEIMSIEMMVSQDVKTQLVSEAKKLLEIIN